jgi:hypothetical protein
MNSSLVYEKETPAVHMIDIENICGCGKPTFEMVADARRRYRRLVRIGQRDRVFITAGVQNREVVFEGWPGAVYKFKAGDDGADILIAQYICENDLARYYRKAYLASGDGELAPYADRLCRMGLDTTVIALGRSLSGRMLKFEHVLIDSEVK